MMKEISKPDYNKMGEGELKLLLNKHQQMLSNTRLINALPDKGQRLRNAINEIEKYLAVPSSPMDCDIIDQFNQMSMSTDNDDLVKENVYLEKPTTNILKTKFDNNFSDERLNDVKQRLKARQAERGVTKKAALTKLISLDDAIQLYNEEKKQTEEHLIQQTTSRLLGSMSLTKTTFGLPSKTDLTYRKTTTEDDADNDDDRRDKAEIESDHDSDEIDYPDEGENNDDDD